MKSWLKKLSGGERGATPDAPPDDDAFTRAFAAHQRGDVADAEAGYREHLASIPDDARALHLLGVLLAQAGKLAEGGALLEQAVCADASSAAFRADLGNVRMLEGRLQDAIGAYRAATEIDPDHALAWGNLASALHARGELGEAADAARRGLAAEAQDTESIASLGRTLLACGAADEDARSGVWCLLSEFIPFLRRGSWLLRESVRRRAWARARASWTDRFRR